MYKEQISNLIKGYKQDMINDLADFISINSVYDETTVDEHNPFGQGVSQALNFFYKLAKRDGFDVINYDNYCVEVTYGEGELLDILSHCDVVDVSDTWSFNPFSKLYDTDYIYGRGTQDDKGPLLAAYYALKAIKDNNIPVNKKIRFIVGGNEESGSACLEHYYNTLKKPYPSIGFTPDADFPLINGEKGITRIEVLANNMPKEILNIYGGRALNIVMDEVVIKTTDEERVYKGKAAHASRPELGENAFINVLKDFKDEYEIFSKLYEDFENYYGKGLKIDSYDEKLKSLTMNIGKVEMNDSTLKIVLDIRYPLSTSAEIIKKQIEAKGYMANILMDEAPIYMDENSYLVKTLINSYNEITGENSKPFTIGGGTYAKSSKNVVAFGMLFEDDVDRMHQDDEKLSIDHYLLGATIYLKALLDLNK